jgi:hypothetical protein
MKPWHKILITIAVMLFAGLAAGRYRHMAFGFLIPSCLAGMAEGPAALPVWERRRWIGIGRP